MGTQMVVVEMIRCVVAFNMGFRELPRALDGLQGVPNAVALCIPFRCFAFKNVPQPIRQGSHVQ